MGEKGDNDYLQQSCCFEFNEAQRKYRDFQVSLLEKRRLSGIILDIGCGSGFFLEMLNRKGYDTHGIDISEMAINEASKITEAHLTVQSADEELPYPDSFFDAVTMFSIIEHIRDYEYTLKEAFRVLKSAGYIFMITPNFQSFAKWVLGKNWCGYRDPTHIHLFSPISLKNRLISAGFIDISIKTFLNTYLIGEHTKKLKILRFNRILFIPEFGDEILAIATK